ncbi:MAG: pilus assembly protein PilM [Patescibacteria group bacterium]
MAANNRLNKIRQKIVSFLRRISPVAGAAFVGNDIYLSFYGEDGLLINKKIALTTGGLDGVKEGIKKIKKEGERNFNSLIVSLPASESFMSVFEFPLTASEEQVEESMKLSVVALPIAEKDVYADWMPLFSKNSNKKEIILMAANKAVIDPYLRIFEENKLAVIAVETYALSLGRFLNDSDEIVMVVICNLDNFIFIIYDGQQPYFQFNLPKRIDKDENTFFKIASKIVRRLIHFARADSSRNRAISSIIVLNNNEFKSYLEKEISGIAINIQFPSQERDWDFGFLSSVGAVKRGMIPRRRDTIISLMPIGTELAYEQQRLFSLIDFFQKFLIGFGGFLIILLSGVFLMINSLFVDIDEMIQKEQNFPVETVAVKGKAILINEKIAKISGIGATTPNWENIFREIDRFTNIGIPISLIKGIGANSSGEFSLLGVAATREILVALKNHLGNSSVFETSALPLSLFLSDKDIDFSVKANIKNPKFLYNNYEF